MARKVFISSDMSIDEAVSEVAEKDPVSALIWPWILTYFDDWGRAKASPREIKNSVFPANDLITIEIIGKAISLYGIKLVYLYQVEGKPYMCINPDKWFKYQTHIRREKRENDGSKHPAPIADSSAQVREGAREYAHISDNLTDCIPSPSPSPSPSITQEEESPMTALEAYMFSFKKIQYTGHIQGYVVELLKRGLKDSFVREVFLEMGARGVNADERYMRKLAEDWISNGILTRKQAEKQKRDRHLQPVPDKKVDKELEQRKIEIARNKWISEGKNPNEFEYRPASND